MARWTLRVSGQGVVSQRRSSAGKLPTTWGPLRPHLRVGRFAARATSAACSRSLVSVKLHSDLAVVIARDVKGRPRGIRNGSAGGLRRIDRWESPRVASGSRLGRVELRYIDSPGEISDGRGTRDLSFRMAEDYRPMSRVEGFSQSDVTVILFRSKFVLLRRVNACSEQSGSPSRVPLELEPC